MALNTTACAVQKNKQARTGGFGLSLAPSKLHTTIALLRYARRCWHRRIGLALGYDLKPLNRDAA